MNPTLADDVVFRWTSDDTAATSDIYLHNGKTAIYREGIVGNEWTPDVSLEVGPWTWWVRARDAQGQFGPWSAAAQTVTGGRPEFLTAPTVRSPFLTWTTVDTATRYILQVDNLTTGERSLIREDNLTSNSLNVRSLTSGTYRTWVQAINSDTNRRSPWSIGFEFTVAAANIDADTAPDSLLQNLIPDIQLATHEGEDFNSRISEQNPVTTTTNTQPTESPDSKSNVELTDRVMEELLTDGKWLEERLMAQL